MVKLDPWIDKPRFASSQGDPSLVASYASREGSTVLGRVLVFEAGGARVEYPADAPVSEGWGPTDGGVSAVGAIVRVLIGSDGRIVLISAPGVLPAGSAPYSTGATGDVVLEAVALSEVARAENAATHAEVVQAQQDLADARDHIENVVEPGLVAAQGAADAAAGEAVQAKADALAAFNKAMQGVTDASAAQSLASQAVQDAAGAQNAAQAAQGTANTAATDLLTLAGRTGRLIRSATAPTAAVDKNANNLWLNTSTGQLHEWTGTAWVVVTDSRITAAASAADQAANLAGNAQTAANTAQTLAQAAQNAANAAAGTATQAKDAADAAITASVTEYAVGASETVAPSTGWSTAQPTRTPGMFVWMRARATYGSGTVVTSSAVLVTGNTGAAGQGIEIVGTVATYANLPTGLGQAGAGKAYLVAADGLLYIWDGSAFPANGSGTQFRGPAGTPGRAGADGVGVTAWLPHFCMSATTPGLPSGATPAGWTTTEPAHVTGQSLWRSERITFSTTPLSYAWTPVTRVEAFTVAVAAQSAASAANTAALAAQSSAQAAQSAASTADGKAVAAQSTANTAVSNAQAAQGVADTAKADAAAAAGIAGGKADVLIQSTAPAVGMRKATTLWIDTTSGANTPKRWSGSAWIAVTDKAATDAATAAASAQTTANTAITNAQSAQTTANTALADAAAAKTAASNAQASALGAQSTADTANQKASTADGRYTVATANPTVSDASGKPLNAVWEVRSGGTAVRRYVLTGATTWTQVKVGQDFVGEKAIGRAQIADVAVGTAQVADAAITNAKVGDLAVDKLTVTGGATFPTAVVDTLIGQDAFFAKMAAQRLVVTPGQLLMDTSFNKAAWNSNNTTGAITVSGTSPSGSPVAVIPAGTAARAGAYYGNRAEWRIPVEGGDKIVVSAWVRTTVAAPADTVWAMVQQWTDAGARMTVSSSSAPAIAANTWVRLTWEITLASTARSFGIYFRVGAAATGAVWIADPRVERKVGGILLEDGAITAPKVNATSELWAKILAVAGNATIGGDLLANGAVTARTMNVVSETSGRFISMKPDGLRLWDQSSDEDSPLVALTSSGDRFFTVTDGQGSVVSSIDSSGGVSGRRVSAGDSLTYKGRSIEDYIRDYVPGVLAYDKRVVSGITIPSGVERRMGRMTVLVPAGRIIRASMRGPSLMTNAGCELQAYFRIATGDAFNADGSAKAPPVATADSDWVRVQHIWGMGGVEKQTVDNATLIGPFSKPTYVSVMTCLWQSAGGSGLQAGTGYNICEHLIEDVGSAAPGYGEFQYINSATVPPTAPTQSHERYYSSSSWGSFYGTGAAVGSGSSYYNSVTQGQWLTATQGAARGLWTFPSMVGDLSGATVEAAQIFLTNEHSRWNYGATAHLFSHANTSVPATLAASTTNQFTCAFGKGQGLWVDIPSSHFAALKSGAIRGYGLYVTGSDNYGLWGKNAQIWLKYTK